MSIFGGRPEDYTGVPIYADPVRANIDVRHAHIWATKARDQALAEDREYHASILQEERKRLVRIAQEIKRQI